MPSASPEPLVYHPEANYHETIFAALFDKANLAYDARDGIRMIANDTGNDLSVWIDDLCQGCTSVYSPTNTSGHVCPRGFWAHADCAATSKLDRIHIRYMHKLLLEKYYVAQGFPGQGQSILSGGGVVNYSFYICSIQDNVVALSPVSASDPRAIPIAPNDVAMFGGGTNFDTRIWPIIDSVDYTGCSSPNYYFTVTLSWDVSYLITGTDLVMYPYTPPPSASASSNPSYATLTISKYTPPYFNSIFNHQFLPYKKRVLIFTPTTTAIPESSSSSASQETTWPALDANDALTLSNHAGATTNVRIAPPVSEDEIPVGYTVESSQPGTFKVEVQATSDSAWVDVTSLFRYTETDPITGAVVWHWWKRVQATHTDAGNDYAVKVYFGSNMPNAAGDGWESAIGGYLLAGCIAARITYWVEYQNSGTAVSRRHTTNSMLCGNCRRDYTEWIADAASGAGGVGKLTVDNVDYHWYCAARTTASGVANFVPGSCCQQRSCDEYYQGSPATVGQALLAEIDCGKWLVEGQMWPGITTPNNFTYFWVRCPSLLLLGGALFDVPTQYFGYRSTQGNGALGHWLYGNMGGSVAVNYGAIYQTNYTPTGYSDLRAGLFSLSPVVNGTWNGVSPGISFVHGKQAISAVENSTSDPLVDGRRQLLRQMVGAIRHTANSGMFYRRARVSGYYNGESRVTRPAGGGAACNVYFPVQDITALTEHAMGEIEGGSWTLDGTEYSLRVQVYRPGRDHGYKRLGGISVNAYGEDINNRGQVLSCSMSAGRLIIDAYPGIHGIARTGNMTDPDDIVYYLAGGNIAELPEPLKPRSRYEMSIYNKVSGPWDKAWAGDAIEFPSVPTLSGKKFYIRTAVPCDYTNFGAVNIQTAFAWGRLPAYFDVDTDPLAQTGGGTVTMDNLYHFANSNYDGTTFTPTNAGDKEEIVYGDARTQDNWYYYWRTDTLSVMVDEDGYQAAKDAFNSHVIKDANWLKCRIYYTPYGYAQLQADMSLFDYVPSVSGSSSVSELAVKTRLSLPYAPYTTDGDDNECYWYNPFTEETVELTYAGDVPGHDGVIDIDTWPASGEYAFAQWGDGDWYAVFHPDYSGDEILLSYKTYYAYQLPASLPTGVTGLPTSDYSYLLKSDRLYVVDENDMLADANTLGLIDETYFKISSSGVFADTGSPVTLAYAVRPKTGNASWISISSSNLWIEKAAGQIYVKKTWVDATLSAATEYCFRVNAQSVGGY